MQSETAKQLVQTITHALEIAIDNRNKITTFERLLQANNPKLFEDYKIQLEKERAHPSTVIFSQGLEALHTKLAQD
jgi:hypothetical protein